MILAGLAEELWEELRNINRRSAWHDRLHRRESASASTTVALCVGLSTEGRQASGALGTSPELATDAPARIYEGRWSQEADGAVRVADVGVVCGRADVRSRLTGSWSRRRQELRKHCG